MARQIYLQLDGIKGDSRNGSHFSEIEIFRWHWPAGDGYFNRRSADNTIYIYKSADRSTADLITLRWNQRRVPSGALTIVTSDDNGIDRANGIEDFIKIRLFDIAVSDEGSTKTMYPDNEFYTLNFGSFFAVFSERDASGAPVEHTLLSNIRPFLDDSDYQSGVRRTTLPWSKTPVPPK